MSQSRLERLVTIVRENRLRVMLQPVVDLNSRRVYGYEALCRGPAGSDLEYPVALFAAAEAANLVPELDEQALRNALALVPYLPAETHLFVNIDPRSLEQKPDLILQALAGVAEPDRIVIELTEHGGASAQWQHGPLERLRQLVSRIALDDLGARHAELQSLLFLHPAFVKMDRSLVQGVGTDRRKADLLRVLVGLGESMAFTPVAEGVENADDLRTLMGLGFRHAQGFVLGRPGWSPAGLSPAVLAALG